MKVLVFTPPTDQEGSVVRDMLYNCWCWGKRIANAESPPVGSLYIASVLKKEGVDVDFVDAGALYKTRKEFIESIKKEYDFIVLSIASMTYNEDMDTIKKLKDRFLNTESIIFGSHATFYAEKVLSRPETDYIILGEAEYSIRDLVRGLDKAKIKGVGYKENEKLHINREKYYIKNLDELPFPDWTLLPRDLVYFHPLVERLPWTTSISSRGCIGKCNFCISPFFFGRYRQRSAQNVVDEMEYLIELGIKEIFYRDETFTVSKKRVLDICKDIQDRGLDVTWLCNSRIDTIDREMMQQMKKVGCHTLKFGVESGNQSILDNINKGTTLEQTRYVFKVAREVGLKTHGHFMLGCTGETKKTLGDTINFSKEINPTTVTFNIFTPFSGTPVYETVIQKIQTKQSDGTEIDLSTEHAQAYYNELFTDLTNKEISTAVRQAYKAFYLRPSYFLDRIRQINSYDRLKKDIKSGIAISSFIFSASTTKTV